jgi:3-oxoacyl-[acyl-carrier-protein] synthase-1
MGLDGRLHASVTGVARLHALAEAALRELVAKLPRRTGAGATIDVRLGLPEPRPGLDVTALTRLGEDLRRTIRMEGATLRVSGQFLGHAAALASLRQAVQQIRSGQASLAIVGGVDSYAAPESLFWLEEQRQIANQETRLGFNPGEGAAFFAIASDELRARLQLPSLARVEKVATAMETQLIKTDCVNLGQGLSAAIVDAAADLRLPDEQIAAVYCDINGERYRSEEWGFALLRTQHILRSGGMYVTASGDCGDLGAAAGALGVVLSVQSTQRGYAQGKRALIWGSSEGGLRAAAVLQLAQ